MVNIRDGNFGNDKSFRSFVPNMADVDNKERIRLAAHDLMMKYGIRSISMDDIATNLGMSKKTIYQFYTDKDALVEAVVDGEINRTRCICENDKQLAENAVHEIVLAIDMVKEIFKTINPSLLFDLHKYHPAAFLKFNQHKNTFLYKIMYDNIQWGKKQKLYRPEINTEILARFRVESMFIPMNQDFHAGINSTLLEAEEQIITHFLYGLTTPGGYEMALRYLNERKKTTDKKFSKQ